MTRPRPRAGRRPRWSAAGDVIGQYKVIEFLGEGGMGTVFEVEHIALGRRYALKVLRTQGDRARCRRPRSGSSARRAPPRACGTRTSSTSFDFGHLPDGRPYFVMELLEGESLDRSGRPRGAAAGPRSSRSRASSRTRSPPRTNGVCPRRRHAFERAGRQRASGNELHVKLVDFGLAELAGEGRARREPGVRARHARVHLARAAARADADRSHPISTASAPCCSSC